MASMVGVLCARVRVEEKQMLQALAEAGVPTRLLPPADAPLPIGPVPTKPSAAALAVVDGESTAAVVIDRCQNRTVASSVLPVRRALGVTVLDAGIAATGTRAEVAAALVAAGIPRPATFLVTSEAAGLAALEAVGYPATYLPLTPGSSEIALLDRDTAEAVFEHRGTLGGSSAAIGILQAGSTFDRGRVSVIVVDGHGVAIHDPAGQARYTARFVGVAEAAAKALGASIVGIELLATPAGPIVWDVNPVPEFRDAAPLAENSVAEAIAGLAASHVLTGAAIVTQLSLDHEVDLGASLAREVANGVALSA
ncbi:MAG: [lysine-biosynthesis-protein LysW]---L-2-aminoadipate ligase [Thermomicrobiales bacterium]|jgi:[lysine-biosynthesis-protein LysW]--L-2-aminoadipate ligase|nr:[lysine-biosynthesis-protein LysW]---L-2-aminoadipate ligase [Thermomicrobiales bacterium]